MKKIIKAVICFTLILLVAVILFLHLAPVSFDAGSCSGGYRSWIVDSQINDLLGIVLVEELAGSGSTYELVSKPEDIASTIQWEDRFIEMTIIIEIDNANHTVVYRGKRYWIEKFNWEIASFK
jgi:hypothetical protein